MRTSSYQAQKAYDRMLADCDISSLRFLSSEYDKRLDRYKESHDLNNSEFWREYRNMQQRKKMIDNELSARIMNKSAISDTYITEFDSTKNIVYGNDGDNDIQYVAFNEDEDGYVITDLEGLNRLELDEFDDDIEKPKKELARKDIYKEWSY